MFEKARLLNLLVCAVFGLLGGMVSHLLFNAGGASAQQTSDVIRANVIKAKRFELIDGDGNVHAVLGQGLTSPSVPAELVLGSVRDGATLSASGLRVTSNGKVRVAVGQYGVRDPGGAYSAVYQLLVQDENEKPKHVLK